MSNLWLPLQNLQLGFSSTKHPETYCWTRLPRTSETQFCDWQRAGAQGRGRLTRAGAAAASHRPQEPCPAVRNPSTAGSWLCRPLPCCQAWCWSACSVWNSLHVYLHCRWLSNISEQHFFHKGPKLLPMPSFSFLYWNVILWAQNDYFFI